ncbi:MAG: hypothetical protein M0R05_07145 [Bacilli bacterium]|nr:hypothetical protein [Bacilli bacterium]MDD4076527.1 hypothetical protein [Bacilli bacterium]MDD4387716.1 hypothetical protein [Bacilli bacterium]
MFLANFLKRFWDVIVANREAVIVSLTFLVLIIGWLIFLSLAQKNKNRSVKSIISTSALILLILIGVTYYLNSIKKSIVLIIIINSILLIIYVLLTLLFIKSSKDKTSQVNTSKIAILGLMTGLAVVLSFFGFPIIPGFEMLRLEFNGLIYILVLLWFGFRSAITVCFLMNVVLLIFPVPASQLFYGYDQIINFISCTSYIIPVGIIFSKLQESEYPSAKKLATATIIGTLFATLFMVFFNYYINVPYIIEADLSFKVILKVFGTFNLVKWGLVTLVVNLFWRKLYDLKYIAFIKQ